MADSATQQSSANGVTWNLADLYASLDDPRLDEDLAAALRRAQEFERTYRGKINQQPPPSAKVLQAALVELESLSEQMDRAGVFGMLAHSAQTDDPKRGALLAKTREARTAINQHLIFFDLEWVALPEEDARQLLYDPLLAKYRHFLEQKRIWKPHYLSEPEEKLLDEKSVTGRAALVRLFDETVAGLSVRLNGEAVPFQRALAKLYDPSRLARQQAASGITQTLKDSSRLLSFLFNTLVLIIKPTAGCGGSPTRWLRGTYLMKSRPRPWKP